MKRQSGRRQAGSSFPRRISNHWMYDAGLYPIEAIRLLQAHWQATQGKPSHKARMKDAGAKAALTRKRSAAARKAVATRKLRAGSLS